MNVNKRCWYFGPICEVILELCNSERKLELHENEYKHLARKSIPCRVLLKPQHAVTLLINVMLNIYQKSCESKVSVKHDSTRTFSPDSFISYSDSLTMHKLEWFLSTCLEGKDVIQKNPLKWLYYDIMFDVLHCNNYKEVLCVYLLYWSLLDYDTLAAY